MSHTVLDVPCPVGVLRVAATEVGISEITWVRTAKYSTTHLPLLKQAKVQLQRYFIKKSSSFNLPLDLQGPEFYKKVWRACTKISLGKTLSYGDLAGKAGSPKAARAAAGAMSHNKIPIIIPCHRVIGAGGSLGGYSGGKGLATKKFLLHHEGAL